MSYGKHSVRVNHVTLSILLSLSCISSTTIAGEWNGSASDDWFEASNWSPAATPDPSTAATINNGSVSLKNNHSTLTQLKIAPGNGHNAQLTLSDGGQLTVTGTGIRLMTLGGDSATNGSGKLFVTGEDAKFTLTSASLYVGQYGQGELQVSGGGKVYLEGASRGMVLADHKTSTGIVGVDGQGSLIDIQGNLTVGGDGNGYLNITNGGTVNTHSVYNGYSLLIGGFNGDNIVGGYVLVDGAGSSLNVGGDMYIGNSSSGILTISDGAKVNVLGSANSYLADSKNDVENSVLVTGQESAWNTGNILFIGCDNSSGTLTVNNGGEVTASQGIGVGYGDYSASAPSDGINVINIGGAKGSAAQAAGYLNTPYLQLFTADKSILNLNHTDNSGSYLLGADIDGSGTINQLAGTTILTGDSAGFSGKTEVSGGRLIVNGELGGQVNIGEFGTLGGGGVIYGNVENAGLLAPGIVQPQTFANGTSSGFTTLTINGNYNGNGGTLLLNSQLSGDSSPTDKLIVNGNTSGLTKLMVNNISGAGNETQEGIQVVQVNGLSDGSFVLEGRAVAGAYEYFLHSGSKSVYDDGHWYLRSELNDQPGGGGEKPEPETDPRPVIRPEPGAYIGNLAAANAMFMHSLHDRLGEPRYTESLKDQTSTPTSMWLRIAGSRAESQSGQGQINIKTNSAIVQLGGDVAQWTNNQTDRLHLGLMAGYGKADTSSGSTLISSSAKGTTDGYSVGAYATWYQNDTDRTGLYIDSWLQYGWFNNEVKGDNLRNERYDSDGISASIETGYTLKLWQTSDKALFVEPQAQVTWLGVTMDDHLESGGTNVSQADSGYLQTRLGGRLFLNGYSDLDKGRQRTFQPFAELNWIHNTKDNKINFDHPVTSAINLKQEGIRDIAELKLGVEGQINQNLTTWFHIGQQLGSQDYKRTEGLVGIKYSF